MSKIGAYLREKRIAKGLTQKELADRLQISNRAVSKWERGYCLPDSANLLGLCDALGVTCEQLLSADDRNVTNNAAYNEAFYEEVEKYATSIFEEALRLASAREHQQPAPHNECDKEEQL